MKELFQILDLRILGIFGPEGEIAVMRRRLHGVVELVVTGEEGAPAVIDGLDPFRSDRVVLEYGKTGVAQ